MAAWGPGRGGVREQPYLRTDTWQWEWDVEARGRGEIWPPQFSTCVIWTKGSLPCVCRRHLGKMTSFDKEKYYFVSECVAFWDTFETVKRFHKGNWHLNGKISTRDVIYTFTCKCLQMSTDHNTIRNMWEQALWEEVVYIWNTPERVGTMRTSTQGIGLSCVRAIEWGSRKPNWNELWSESGAERRQHWQCLRCLAVKGNGRG